MASPAQFAANIANSVLSTGPQTPEGKQTSSLNALTHGMTSRKIVLPHESEEAWTLLRESTIEHYRPANELERSLALRVAETMWRAGRADRIHDAFIADRTAALQREQPEAAGDFESASVLLFVDPVEQKRFSLMMRYHTAAHREHRQVVAELQKVQKTRIAREQEEGLLQVWLDGQQERVESALPAPPAVSSAQTTQCSALPRRERRALERAERKAERKAMKAQNAAALNQSAAA